ncbi:T9SS type A sorting domain-containing protein [Flavobacterium sp. I3-2]|uniref:T9SS type A sorting domain-containing protein n=1 Tax=Flavobacterium sp. I3-2 TaxID=2748319 RepID=UPI0015ABCB9F|nr:S8 family serine peptidase [Flavobacterium sp. I3-2]
MKKKLLVVLLLVLGFKTIAQERKGQFRLTDDSKHQLLISFDNSEQIDDVITYQFNKNPEFQNFVSENNLEFKEAFTWDEIHFNQLRQDAIKYSNSDASVTVLKGFYLLETELPNDILYQYAQKLEAFKFVRYVELNNQTPIVPPSVDIPPVTPNYVQQQVYIQTNPGVNMQYAWNQGVLGQNVRVRDVEYGMSITHEELSAPKFSNANPINALVDSSWLDHGTATAGVVAAHNGTYGITGMQHGISEFKVFPEYTTSGYSRVSAVNASLQASLAGDVVIFEMQTYGFNYTNEDHKYVVAEYENSIWDLTKAMTDAGIHVVAAAGNGNQNLDLIGYQSYMNRGNSGAVIVGAGSPNTLHERLYFSTYGQRVDLQGWGFDVVTSGYGDYALLGNDSNQSYTQFNGTSSATPIVASCVIALVSRAKATNRILTPNEARTILKETGIAQGGNTTENIGPIPNMQAALQYLDNYLLSTNKVDAIPMKVYPNPANNEIFISFSDEFSTNNIAIYDTLGRQVFSTTNYQSDNPIDISFLNSGMYILKMKSNQAEQSHKIIKK